MGIFRTSNSSAAVFLTSTLSHSHSAPGSLHRRLPSATMKLTTALTTLAAATLVSSTSLFGESQNVIATDDDKLSVPGKNPLNYCADPKDYILTIDHVDLDPNPPKPGEKLTISADGTLSEQIEPGATVFLQVKYGLITLIKQEADLCDNLPKIDIECLLLKELTILCQRALSETRDTQERVCKCTWRSS